MSAYERSPAAMSRLSRFLRSVSGQVLLGLVPLGVYTTLLLHIPGAGAFAHRFPFFTMFPMIILASALGGWLAGSITTVLGTGLLSVYWIEEMGIVGHAAQGLYLVFGGVIGWAFERLHTREEQLREAVARSASKTEELDAAVKQLRASEAARSDFLASLSHELRTPLNVIMGYARMLQQAHSDDARRRMLTVVERNAVAQLRLVEDLLDMQRMVTGRFTIQPSPMKLDRVAHAVVESLRPQASAKHLHLHTSIEPVHMVGDGARIQQVLWNLLSNAIKFTPPTGCVGLYATRQGSEVVITVQDSGEGIPAHFLPHVFERFRQLDTGQSRRHFGMGLGLAIVKEVVEQHGGTVRAESEGEGRGATFIATFPDRPPAPEAEQAAS